MWRRAHTFRPERGRAATWVRLLARSRSIDAVRARRARRTETLATDPATSSADPAVRGELRDAVRHALATLRPEERAVVEHSVYGGLSQAETAAALALPLSTVKTRTRYAHGRLRAMLRTHCPE